MIANLAEIEKLAMRLPMHERMLLIDRLRRSMVEPVASIELEQLRGSWRGLFPNGFDIDAALRGIRSEWMREDAA